MHSWSSDVKKVIRKRKPKTSPSNKFYSTVWLSDYESEFDKKSEADFFREDSLASFSHRTTPHDSHVTSPYSSQPVSPYSSRVSSPTSSRPVTPSTLYTFEDEDSGLPSETDKSYEDIARHKKNKIHRTLSLPDSELNQMSSEDLHDRFTTLQLEQENRSLKKLTADLQFALEKLEERVNEMQEEKSKEVQRCEVDSLDEPSSSIKQTIKPSRHLDIPLESPQSNSQNIYQPKPLKKKSEKHLEPKQPKSKSRHRKRDQANCCIS